LRILRTIIFALFAIRIIRGPIRIIRINLVYSF